MARVFACAREKKTFFFFGEKRKQGLLCPGFRLGLDIHILKILLLVLLQLFSKE